MFRKAAELNEVGEVSNVLHIPLSILDMVLAVCLFVEAIVLMCLLGRTLSVEGPIMSDPTIIVITVESSCWHFSSVGA